MFSRYFVKSLQFSMKKLSFISYDFKKSFRVIPTKLIYLPITMVGSFLFYSLHRNYSVFSTGNTLKFKLEGFNNMQDGEMRPFKYGHKDHETILIVKYNGKFHALSNSCPHFGAPLHTGVMIDNIIKCPWHGANFDIETGMSDLYPSLDSLSKYVIHQDNGELVVFLPKEMKGNKVNEMSKRDPLDNRVYAIVGGGPAALACAETLRQMNYTGQIIIFTEENYTPYDRTQLTKWMVPSVDKLALRNDQFLKEYDIEVRKNIRVTEVNPSENFVKIKDLKNGQEDQVIYDKCLLAMGSAPTIPNIPGFDYKGVFTLRSFQEFENIKKKAEHSKNIIIVGASFIGMESASNLKKAHPNANIIIIDQNEFPFEKILGKEVGKAIQKLHSQNGINFKMNSRLTSLHAHDENVKSVVLTDGTILNADMVIMGTGVLPKTEILNSNDAIELYNRSIKCDSYLQTSNKNIFAAGDVCSVPYMQTGERVLFILKQIQFSHYTLAQQQGAVAAMNMLGQRIIFDYLPFFWTRFWDKGLQYVSSNDGEFDEVFIDGNMFDLTFCAYYLKNNKVVSFAAMNTPNAVNIVYEAMRANVMPNGTTIKSGRANLDTIKNNLKGIRVKCKRVDCLCEARRNRNMIEV